MGIPPEAAELACLKARLEESEHARFQASTELLALRLQLEQAQLAARLQAEERQRLEAHNILLMKELRDARNISLVPQVYGQHAFSPMPPPGLAFDHRAADVFPS